MNNISIYRGAALLASISPEENSTQQKQLMGENTLLLSFTLPLNNYIDFQLNDYCTVFEERYKICVLPTYQKQSSHKHTLTLHGSYYDLKKVLYKFLGPDNRLRQTIFYLTGTASDFLNLLLDNANLVNGAWFRGDVIASGYKTLSFSGENCLQALQRIAEAFGTEWWVEGKTIHLSRRRTATDLRLQYGEGLAATSITRSPVSDANIVTRLFVVGSTKNIPSNYRDGQDRLKMRGGIDSIDAKVDLYGVIEDKAVFDDIFPHRTGRVTALGGIYSIFDSTLNFDINQQLLPGVEAKITFNTGQLSGYEFKIQSYNPTTKEIRFLRNQDEKTREVPSALLSAQMGDEYVLTDIQMPQSYIDEAERQLAVAGETLLSKISRPQYSYAVAPNEINLKGRRQKIELGAEVQIDDANLGRVERLAVSRFSRNLKNEWQYSFDISDSRGNNPIAQLQSAQAATDRQVREIADTVLNSALAQNRFVGTIQIDSLPVAEGDMAAYTPVLINKNSSKLYKAP